MSMDALADPVINSPYDEPTRHFALDEQGRPTGTITESRRASEFFVPIPKPKKGGQKAAAPTLDFGSLTDERVTKNDTIDQLRDALRTWRLQEYPGATAISRKLLLYWSAKDREDRILFAQREAAETAIYLAEIAGRDKYESRVTIDWRETLSQANAEHNAGLPRVALKMATGAGKTIVMSMLIAWQTLNKVASPQDSRFVKRFLIVTPGITIKDRLRVLQPTEPRDINYYDVRGVVPQDLRVQLNQAEIHIVNYHQFQPRTTAQGKGISANTRKLLLQGRPDQGAFSETPQMVITRVLDKLGRDKGEIVVFNDEAHHCYQPKTMDEKETAEEKEANEDARVWFKGLVDLRRFGNKNKDGVKTVYDLSATPFYLSGTGYGAGTIFPWVVSDFGLMDAIESGIVKVPRLPVDDNAQGKEVTYLHLYDALQSDDNWPRNARAAALIEPGWKNIPGILQGALESLYASYEKSYVEWEQGLRDLGEPPPVMIVVTANTSVSKLIYEWIAGHEVEREGATRQIAGNLRLFSNVVDDHPVAIPRTIIVDSRQLESGSTMKDDFKKAAADEIAAFKQAYRRSNPGADVDQLDDSDLLREVMNTVGKKGMLGAEVRCVVSVAMLTEGWDANTVTHILGVRAFGSQLLCEQVIGRGLRRRSYAPDDRGFFPAEYANVYGIPFSFIPSDVTGPPPTAPEPSIRVKALDERRHLRIEFPRVTGYRMEWPESPIDFDLENTKSFTLNGETVPSRVEIEGIVGASETIRAIEDARPRSIAFAISKRIMDTYVNIDDNWRPWVFPQLVAAVGQWIAHRVHVEPGFSLGHLRIAELQQKAAEHVWHAVQQITGDESGSPLIRPILNVGNPIGSTDEVFFDTRKKVWETTNSHVSHVTLDGKDGNSWERRVAQVCDALAAEGTIDSYVKNDHLGLTIPYVHKGRRHEYWPDFVVHFDDDRYLIVEVSGSQKSPGPTIEKARTARDSWCASVNNHGAFGRWGYLELGKAGVENADYEIRQALDQHRAGAPIIGDPDLLSHFITEGA
ncbi:BPTD_3080 family restriction endonuclease [Lysinimonas soli]|uniref:BPTD_3080 family restriction endonuclease n=1 Tax=Lysinimonas soli TaxID=1074233 RepID=A0ABW0NJA1_9MICO